MDFILDPILFKLDRARGTLLGWVLRFAIARALFTDRAVRLLVLFSFAVAVYLPASLFFPVWVAVLGPLVYGLPHILASLRYAKLEARPSLKGAFVALWLAVTLFRLGTDLKFWTYENTLQFDIEFASWALGFALLAWQSRSVRGALGTGLLFGFVLLAAWHAPLALTAFLLLFHNAVAFIYWIHAARTARDRATACLAMLAFLAISALIVLGAFDGLYKILEPQGDSSLLKLGYGDFGQSLAPWSSDYRDWFHFFSCYVFGQSLHYFVWLKAIPDQHLPQQTPLSFRRSKELFLRDFGPRLGKFLGLACVVSLGTWVFLSVGEARAVYFAVAAYHGFYELTNLPFLRWTKPLTASRA